jgi:glycosyltransferase involved in cell wall biosynthesis
MAGPSMKSVEHIVLLTPGFARDEQDTTCIPFLQDYVLALHRFHPELRLSIVSLQYPFDRSDYRWNGISVYSAHGKNSRFPSRFLTWYRVWKQLNKLHKEKLIDVIHTFWLTEASLIGKLFCHLKGIKLVAYSIGQDTIASNKYLKLLRLQPAEIITMSERLRKNLDDLGITTGGVIPLGIEPLKFPVTEKKRDIDLIGIGALTELKNYGLFIDLVAEIQKQFPNIQAEIIGEGPQENMLAEKIRRLGVEKNIALLGKIPHSDIHSKLGRAKLLLHTSRFEGQSTVMMEALASGTHVVCFDVGRFDEPSMIHVCLDKEKMILVLKELLGGKELSHTPVVLQSTATMVSSFMALYQKTTSFPL